MLPRILPWLWRLADEGQGHVEVAPQQQQQLLAALAAAAGSAQDPQVCVPLCVKMINVSLSLQTHCFCP